MVPQGAPTLRLDALQECRYLYVYVCVYIYIYNRSTRVVTYMRVCKKSRHLVGGGRFMQEGCSSWGSMFGFRNF